MFHDTIHLPNISHTQKWFGERGLGHNRYRLSNFGSSQLLPHGEARIDRIDRCIYHHQPCPSNKATGSIQPNFSMAQRSLNLSDSLTGGDFCDGFLSTKFLGPPVGLVVRWKTTSGIGQIKAKLSNKAFDP